jgi:gas vesicle protein
MLLVMIYNNMDTKQLQVTLSNLITTRTDELAVFQAALSILNETYKTNFDALTVAQKEADDSAATVADLTSQVSNVQSQLSDRIDQVNNADDLTTLQSNLSDKMTPPIAINPPRQLNP